MRPAAVGSETLDLQLGFSGDREPGSLILQQQQGLSLKARESASLSLKRIFDQINAGNYKSPTPCENNLPEPASSYLQASVDLQLAPPSKLAPLEPPRPLERSADVGLASSEVSSFSSDKSCQPEDFSRQIRRGPPHHQAMEGAPTSRIYGSTIAKPGATRLAPLTIFYGGMVYVYEDVPADKAHAIMLLAAGSGDCSRALMTAQPRQKLTNRSQAELPFARKASLTRFLEKRKDRVQAKAAAASEANSERPSKKLCTEPTSPIPPQDVDQ